MGQNETPVEVIGRLVRSLVCERPGIGDSAALVEVVLADGLPADEAADWSRLFFGRGVDRLARMDKSNGDTLRFDDPFVLLVLLPSLLALYFIVLNAEHLSSRMGEWATHLPTWLLLSASLLIVWQLPFAWLLVALAAVTLIVAARLDHDAAEPRPQGLPSALLA